MDIKLKRYIMENIKSKYASFDGGHNISHFNFVTKNCVKYGQKLIDCGYDIDLEIAYIAGAYHDIGIIFGRENHAKKSGEIVRNDEELKKYYSQEDIELIAQAVEDHSADLSYEPRSIYGKLVADSDKNNTQYLVFSRPIKFSLKYNPKNWTKKEHVEGVYNHVQSKFGKNGYVKYWLDIPETKLCQKAVWDLLDNKDLCLSYISGLFDEITKGKYRS